MNGKGRFDELDAARGIAILMMILYHTVFDLYFFRIWPVQATSGFWRFFAFTTASLFLFIAGVSLSVSYSRAIQSGYAPSSLQIWKKYLGRGAFVLGCGFVVSLATFLYLSEGYVVFGILHVIGVTIMFSPVLLNFGRLNVIIGAVVIVAGLAISCSGVTGPAWMIPLGIHPASFSSVDYEPLFPWSGLLIAGIGFGSILYPHGKRAFLVPESVQNNLTLLSALGRHSLAIYFVHQPVIILLLYFCAGIPLPFT